MLALPEDDEGFDPRQLSLDQSPVKRVITPSPSPVDMALQRAYAKELRELAPKPLPLPIPGGVAPK